MNITQQRFVKRASVVAVRGALAAMVMIPGAYAADARDPAVAELTDPVSTVEVGVGYVNRDSFKFGEYNGLEDKGAYGIGNFNLRGGDAYDSGGTFRWRAYGTDLGLDVRNVGADLGVQGKYRLKYDYDEIRRNFSDSYQTIYNGAGTSTQTIPGFASVPAASRGSSTTTAAGALSNWQNIQAPYATAACATTGGVPTLACSGPGNLIPAAMHGFDIDTQRKKHTLDYTQELMPGWEIKASVRHEDKDGSQINGVAFGGPARGVLVAAPVDTSTDQYRASLGYVNAQSYFTLGYTGSIFKNNIDKWTVENPFNGTLLAPSFNNSAWMPGAPDNEMHQFSLSGGYNFTPTTRLVVSGHYQRMTQNKGLLTGLPSTWVLPETSANAKVIDTTLNATLTARPLKNLGLTAAFKYDDRDNKTQSLNWSITGGDAATAPSLFTNRPLDFKTTQFILDADYALGRRQSIKAGYEWKEVKRTVEALPPSPAELESPFDAEKTTENTFRAEYRNNLSQFVGGRISYAYSQRRSSDYEENVLLPTPTVAPFPAADPALPGFRQVFLADRNRDRVRGTLNMQPSDTSSVVAGLEYDKDDYPNSPYGVKGATSWVFNLDGAMVASETLSFNAFYTYEDKKQQLDSLGIGRGSATTILDAPAHVPGTPCTGYFAASGRLPSDEGTDSCRQWSEQQSDRVHTFGVGVKAKGLLNGKFDLDSTVAYSRATTPISVGGGLYFGNGSTAAAPAFNNVFVAAQSFPDITSETIEWRLSGKYSISKSSAVRLSYIYKHLKSSDWQYDAYTNSALGPLAIQAFPGVGMTSPNYNVQVIGASYIYSFK